MDRQYSGLGGYISETTGDEFVVLAGYLNATAGGVAFAITITPAALPILGQTITPAFAKSVTIEPASLTITGGAIYPVFVSSAYQLFDRATLSGTFVMTATVSGSV